MNNSSPAKITVRLEKDNKGIHVRRIGPTRDRISHVLHPDLTADTTCGLPGSSALSWGVAGKEAAHWQDTRSAPKNAQQLPPSVSQLGELLWDQLFADWSPDDDKAIQDQPVDLVILIPDPLEGSLDAVRHLERLPWQGLARLDVFWGDQNWGVRLCLGEPTGGEVRVRDPAILLLGARHELKAHAQPEALAYVLERQLKSWRAQTAPSGAVGPPAPLSLRVLPYWPTCPPDTTDPLAPQPTELQVPSEPIWLFYGRPAGTAERPALALPLLDGPQETSVADIAAALRGQTTQHRPALIHLHLLQTPPAGWATQVGRVLQAVCGAVTWWAEPEDCPQESRWQGPELDVLHYLCALLEGPLPPSQALAVAYHGRRGGRARSGCVGAYRTWHVDLSSPPPGRLPAEAFIELDRRAQIVAARAVFSELSWRNPPRALAFVWAGPPEQGPHFLHRRIHHELTRIWHIDAGADALFFEARLPLGISLDHWLLEPCYTGPPRLGFWSQERLNAMLRDHNRKMGTRRLALYFKHVIPEKLFPGREGLEKLMAFWKEVLMPQLPPKLLLVLGLSVEESVGEASKEGGRSEERPEDRPYHQVLGTLAPLEPRARAGGLRCVRLDPPDLVPREELEAFFEEFGTPSVWKHDRAGLIARLLEKSEGGRWASIKDELLKYRDAWRPESSEEGR